MASISSIFGYILNYIYILVKNYGLAIIIFSVLLKLILLPLSIKQQRTMKKSAKVQEKMKEIQNKYKNDQNKMNQEIMELYKKEKMSPFGGCLSSIIQIILIIAMFGLVRNPLTYMKKIDIDTINNYKTEMQQELGENSISRNYPEISILKYVSDYKGNNDNLYINTNFLGLDLSNIPQENLNNPTVYIIPVLYVLTSIISMKITTKMTSQKNIKNDNNIEEKKSNAEDMTAQMSKNMSLFMPLMAVSVSIIAPLGLALYWLVNNILMIGERILLDKFLKSEEEEQNG